MHATVVLRVAIILTADEPIVMIYTLIDGEVRICALTPLAELLADA